MYNKVILVGNLTRDVELKNLPSGSAVSTFGLATNKKWRDGNSGEDRQEVMFIDITVFGRSAEIANQYLRKGSKVLIEGRLSFEQWTDQNGQKRSKHKIIADSVQFMESRAEAQANQNNNNSYGGQDNGNSYGNQGYNNNQNQNNYSNNNYSSNTTAQPKQMQQQNNIPDIDVENDDIPF
jgi:single-strand DNA-binding protein